MIATYPRKILVKKTPEDNSDILDSPTHIHAVGDAFVNDGFFEELEILDPGASWKIMDKIGNFTELGIKINGSSKISNSLRRMLV